MISHPAPLENQNTLKNRSFLGRPFYCTEFCANPLRLYKTLDILGDRGDNLASTGSRKTGAGKRPFEEIRNKGGAPKKEKPEALEQRVNQYFADCDERGRFPTEPGMLLHLGLSGEKLQRYLADPKYQEVWERAKMRRNDWLENHMVTDGRCANGCMNALKQEKNGGYADRSAPEKKQKRFSIVMQGVGKDAAK